MLQNYDVLIRYVKKNARRAFWKSVLCVAYIGRIFYNLRVESAAVTKFNK